MSLQQTLEQKLTATFKPDFLLVENESHMHSVPQGSESHFKVVVVSQEFENKMLIKRHRMINECLSDELKNQLHALAIHTFTSAEWAEKNDKSLASPLCHGGSKS